MASVTIRLSEKAHRTLRALAERDGVTLQAEVDRAVELYRRQRLLDEANAAFAALRSNPRKWKQESEQRRAWEATLGDGQDERS